MLNRLINAVIVICCTGFVSLIVYKTLLDDKYITCVIVFEEPVNGLVTGSQVLMNGIKIGKVTRLKIPKDAPSKCMAIVCIKQMETSLLEAEMTYLGVTGNKGINLSFAKNPVEKPKIDGMFQIASTQSLYSRFIHSTSGITKDQIDSFIKSAEEIANSVKIALYNINNLIVSVNEFVTRVVPISDNITILSKNINEITKKIPPIVTRISKTIDIADEIHFDESLKDVKNFIESLNRISKKLELTLNDFSNKPIRFMIRGSKPTAVPDILTRIK